MATNALHGIVPLPVKESRMSAGAKMLYCEYTTLCNESGMVHASASYLSTVLNVSQSTINRWIAELSTNNHIIIKPFSDDDIVQEIKQKGLYGKGIGGMQCEWCGIKTAVLHSHHYPVLKGKGGKETVNICPNCHHEFHYFVPAIRLNCSKEEIADYIRIRELGKIKD